MSVVQRCPGSRYGCIRDNAVIVFPGMIVVAAHVDSEKNQDIHHIYGHVPPMDMVLLLLLLCVI